MKISFVNNVKGHCRLCTKEDGAQDMVACDNCDRWFHYGCVNLASLPRAEDPWSCTKCTRERTELQKMRLQLSELALEVEGRTRAQRSAEMHASEIESELARCKDQLGSKDQEDTNKQDVLLTLAQIIQRTKEDGDATARIAMENGYSGNEANETFAIYMKRQGMGLPQFFGNAKEWLAFKKVFETTTEAGKYSNLENWIRLQKALGGPAARSVQALMLDPDNIPQIMDRLGKQFGQAEKVYKELREDLEKIRAGSYLVIVEIANALEGLVAYLTATNQIEFLRDPRMVEEAIHKLSLDMQVKWKEVVEDNKRKGNSHPTLQDLYKWIKPRADILREISPPRQTADRRNRVNMHQESQIRCIMCKGAHRIMNCQQFIKLTPEKRQKEIERIHACKMCLRRHQGRCWYPVQCGVQECKGWHNKMLHKRNGETQTPKSRTQKKKLSVQAKAPATEIEETSNLHQEQKAKVFYQIIPVTLRNKERIINTYAFLDPGSSLTLVDEGVAEELQLEGVKDPLRIKWTQNVSREEKMSQRVQLKIKGNSNREFTLSDVRTVANLHLPIQTVNYENLQKEYPFLEKLPVESFKKAQPKLLIGLNHSHLLYPLEKRAVGLNNPIAIKTKLGWLIFGNIKETAQEEHVLIIQEEDKMHTMMQRYFSTEDFGVKIPINLPESKRITRAKDLINQTLQYKEGRYEIGLLWKEDNFRFPDSYTQAYKRLLSLEGKLERDVELKRWAIDTIAEYVKKGYARKLTAEEARAWSKEIYYLPHFIVVNKNKSPPKPRLVFDAAAEVKGISLNSALLSGPDATTSSFGVTTRFREGNIATAGDIKEMFSQVKISEADQRKQCFLFRDCNSSREPEIYVMQVMIFGATCSPACAQVVKNHNASLFSETKPEAARAVVTQHYVDDYIDSFDSTKEAIKTIKDVIEIHDNASFFIRNFVSNSKAVLAALPTNRVQNSTVKMFEDKESTSEKVLGVYWNTKLDCISFQVKFDRMHQEVKEGLKA